ncbi:testis-expressed protein 22 isoform X1 [Eumetopias jubatus]|uniref:testis-expressed protein 22 isoform X1 n=1 Tax=Eumetopias jubatus TaxID=34886 RepID=UPI001016871C|nr:testis-expressed protein 22 isoform X1 [Eumetopias jubatus]
MDRLKPLSNALLGKKPKLPLPQEPSPALSPTMAWDQPGAQGERQQPQTQDWVCEPPESRCPNRHWSVSIDERRRLATQGGWEEPGTGGPPRYCRDIAQLVAQLVSEDVDKDVLLPHPLRSPESANAFHAFLARSAPFWRTVTLEAQAGTGAEGERIPTRLPSEHRARPHNREITT